MNKYIVLLRIQPSIQISTPCNPVQITNYSQAIVKWTKFKTKCRIDVLAFIQRNKLNKITIERPSTDSYSGTLTSLQNKSSVVKPNNKDKQTLPRLCHPEVLSPEYTNKPLRLKTKGKA